MPYVTLDVTLLLNKVLSKEDRVLIIVLRVAKGYDAKRIMTADSGKPIACFREASAASD